MNASEASRINKFLANIKGRNKSSEIFIDNLHSPYFEFQEYYNLPSISTTHGVDFNSSLEYLTAISSYIPELIQNTFILPEPRPKKDIYKIFLIRDIPSIHPNLNQEFIWILSLDVGYLGGSTNANILKPKSQGYTASVITNRIYFQSKIIPIESLICEGNEIRGFNPFEIKELLDDLTSRNNSDPRIKPFSELFDEPDYSSQEDLICKMYKIDSKIWKLGKIYFPIGIEYLSLGFRLIEDKFESIQTVWNRISNNVWLPDRNYETQSVQPLHDYLSLFYSETSMSPSGNIRWKIRKESK